MEFVQLNDNLRLMHLFFSCLFMLTLKWYSWGWRTVWIFQLGCVYIVVNSSSNCHYQTDAPDDCVDGQRHFLDCETEIRSIQQNWLMGRDKMANGQENSRSWCWVLYQKRKVRLGSSHCFNYKTNLRFVVEEWKYIEFKQ